MTNYIEVLRSKILSATILIVALFSTAGLSQANGGQLSMASHSNTPWVAPSSADNLKNPFIGNATATTEGKKLFTQLCVICHGNKGKGDGVAGVALKPKPANFASSTVQAQSDGKIYWKLTEGRPPMVSYKGILTDQQRWQLVNYIRELGKK